MAELYGIRGFVFTHETVRDWEERFGLIVAEQLRAKRRHKLGQVWFVDETYIRVKGKWCYLYCGIDENGNLVDVLLSEKRDSGGQKKTDRSFWGKKITAANNGRCNRLNGRSRVLGESDHHRVYSASSLLQTW